ncbi:SDR family NAD(P)-dependent oxidoreductase, partial [Actinacidiphila glaucinigra]|uniref:SDR family NAD(P)-dependent oxidoreductase n=1 Tax=Actinacidiphila glaucinigra TaxID=235986 RepID=UPI0035DCEAAB
MSSFPSRTAVVTGASSGIGWETARLLAERNWTVIVHAPDIASGQSARDRLIAAGADASLVHTAVADFARLDAVRSMASAIAAAHPVIDVLVNNAAVAAPERHTITEDGNELSFQVNFLAAYLLTRELTAPLSTRTGSRVINVSSSMHRTASIQWNDLNRTRRYSRLAAYAQSQLALTVFAHSTGAYTELPRVSWSPRSCDQAVCGVSSSCVQYACSYS